MIDFSVYKLLHLLGLFLLFFSCGVYYLRLKSQGDAGGAKVGAWTGGGGMFLVLLGGFGMLARMELPGGWPGWIHAKMTLWVIAAVLVFMSTRGKLPAKVATPAIFVIGAFAAFLALWKPF